MSKKKNNTNFVFGFFIVFSLVCVASSSKADAGIPVTLVCLAPNHICDASVAFLEARNVDYTLVRAWEDDGEDMAFEIMDIIEAYGIRASENAPIFKIGDSYIVGTRMFDSVYGMVRANHMNSRN